MAVADVWAVNAKGEPRLFTAITWDLLGKGDTRDGWTRTPDVNISNVASSIPKPSTGQKTPVTVSINNVLDADKGKQETKQNISNETQTDEQKKAEFLKIAYGLKKGDIKDFFDKQDPNVEYKNNWKPVEFIEKLGEHLKYDSVELKKVFSL